MKTRYIAKELLLLFIIYSSFETSFAGIDTTSFKLFTRQTFYSYETEAEILLHVPGNLANKSINAEIFSDSHRIAEWRGVPGKKILSIKIPVPDKPSAVTLTCNIALSGSGIQAFKATTKLYRLAYKPNEVKCDNLTGGLIVYRRDYFPFGFYCYSPVHPTLPEEEVVKGFNMISPYQKILPESLPERKAYMDRCAQLGMKVHYNLLSVSGGGGVGSKIDGLTDEKKRELLINEVKTFMDHPALLAWYISDEPNGYKIPPAVLEEIYNTIKSLDPWHPVTMVFMAPFISARNYENALDIVMADPYPVPVRPVTLAGDAAGQLKNEFLGKKPVWIVPQAFGGGEWWEREPTIQEMRSMTWQAIIRGATGIQYFVRQGMSYFPKSAAAWGECGRMAVEVAELSPWLLSDEAAFPVESLNSNILVTSRMYKGRTIILAVNKTNDFVSASIRVKGLSSGKANVLFENRIISFSGGVIREQVAPFGTKAFLIVTGSGKTTAPSTSNMIKDPGFEDLTAPGIPSACYARPGGDRGATFFLDSRESVDGFHSLRLITPAENKGVAIRFFPVTVKAGKTYSLSLWARSDPEQRFSDPTAGPQKPQYAEVQLGEFGRARFIPGEKWKEYITFVSIPADTTTTVRTNLILKMPGQGVGWFDIVKVVEEK